MEARNEERIIKKIDWDEVRAYVRASSRESSVYIGCDSKQDGKMTRFGLAVVVHINSSNGGKLFAEVVSVPRIKALRQRLLKEVELVVQGALEIVDAVGDRNFEVHLDVNPDEKHKSNEVHREAVGWVTGQGLEVRVKPAAFAASYAADFAARM